MTDRYSRYLLGSKALLSTETEGAKAPFHRLFKKYGFAMSTINSGRMKEMNTDKRLNWIDSAGGPLILIEQTYLNYWKGIFSDQEPTDYNRACAIDNYISLIEVGDGKALVLGDMPMRTAWSPLPNEPGGIIICWGYANNEASVAQAVSSVPNPLDAIRGTRGGVGRAPRRNSA